MAAVPQRAMTPGEWGLLLLLSLLWGGSFFFIGVAVKELPPLTIVTARVSLAAALLWLTAPLTGLSPGSGSRRRPRARGPRPRQQRHSLHADRLGADASGERPRLDPQRDDAGLHGDRRAFSHRQRTAQRAPARRRPVRLPRRGVDDRARSRARPRRQCRGGARRARRRAVLRPGEHLRAAVSRPRPRADRRSGRTGRRVEPDADSARARGRPPLGIAGAEPRRDRRGRSPSLRFRRPWPTSSISAFWPARARPTSCW